MAQTVNGALLAKERYGPDCHRYWGLLGGNPMLLERHNESISTPSCPECKSDRIIKAGIAITRKDRKQRLQCRNCGRIFYKR